jgi:serine/threonine protein kinase/dipeptidyl aminopeptidase/acylaminoacyl peptidase
MALAAGTKLGSYEVLSAIGAGGMGEVYQAHDTKLGRDVAIKVLPEAFAHDSERLSRFQREAKMLAALNHPNIATIHGLEQSGGTSYLVMELVSGETLAERLKAGPLGVEEALKIAVQIAEALEAAHEKSIIHRDLKPANVKVTPEGKVKVLDFGLAKAFAGDTATVDIGNSPTLSQAATMQGVILGTAAYMSPEQARGKAVNKATDIWAFGCVLYEMLTGKKAFDGEDVTEILAAVVKTEPNWNCLPETTPPAIRLLLRRCLRKDRRQRLQDATGVRIEIDDALAAPASIESSSVATAAQGWQRLAVLAVAALGFLALGGGAAWYLKPSLPRPPSPAHVVVVLPPGDQLVRTNPPVEISSDGAQMAYAATRNGVQQLFMRSMDDPEAKPIPGTDGAYNPFSSPDSQWIGFFAQGKMKKISIHGGVPVTLCDAGLSGGASWGTDDTIIFVPSGNSGLWRVSAAGGKPEVLTTPDLAKGEYSHRYPQVLPGGKGVLFTAFKGFGWDESRVELLRLDTKERTVLVRGGQTGRYVPSGYLIYYRAGSLLSVPFDLGRLEVTKADPVTIAEGVRLSSGTDGAAYSVSAAGTLAYVSASPRQFESRLVWVDRQGGVQPIPAPPRAYAYVSLSRDGKQVVVAINADTSQLWTYDLARGALTQLTSGQGSSYSPVWTPDGKRVAYRSNKAGNWNLFWRPSDGSKPEERLTTSENAHTPYSFSPDGQLLSFSEINPTSGYDIWVLRLGDPSAAAAGSGQVLSTGSGQARKAQLFLRTPFNETMARFSPDGRWLAYQSDESGGYEVSVQPYPGRGGKWRISAGGGTYPQWNPNGRELFYRNGDKMMAVDVTTSPSFSSGTPKMLFEGQDLSNWDVSPDGQRFLMIKPVEQQQAATQINVVLNWFEELKQKVPVGKK